MGVPGLESFIGRAVMPSQPSRFLKVQYQVDRRFGAPQDPDLHPHR